MAIQNREEELKQIENFINSWGVKLGPTAFVCPSVQKTILCRYEEFIHSNVKLRGMNAWSKKKK